ncbi:MAG: hypothetical protein JWO02_2774 [Solirubrobacterales bacterium]|nr:hypothetical protein [Solirubrobacterales bacterium]
MVAATSVTLLTATAAPAQGTPSTVTIRIEGASTTLVPATSVTTTAAPVDKAGTPCSGTSAGGALEQATRGAWAGTVQPGVGQTVQMILSERHPTSGDPRTFVLSVNSVPTAVSPCALELNPGDTVLLFVSSQAPLADCRTNGRDGFCGTPDRTAPVASITSIREHQRFSRANAPRVLRGGVSFDPAGLVDVKLRLTRVIGTRRCAYFSGIEDSFQRATACGAVGPRFFSIGSAPAWSFALPARLTRGRYTLDVAVTDTQGNVSTAFARGRDRIVFTVG